MSVWGGCKGFEIAYSSVRDLLHKIANTYIIEAKLLVIDPEYIFQLKIIDSSLGKTGAIIMIPVILFLLQT
jgi:hypothetical protein